MDDGRAAVREIGKELARVAQVYMRVGEAGDEIQARSIDSLRTRGNRHDRGRADLGDAAVAEDDRRLRERALGVHRHDRHVRDRRDPPRPGHRPCPPAGTP